MDQHTVIKIACCLFKQRCITSGFFIMLFVSHSASASQFDVFLNQEKLNMKQFIQTVLTHNAGIKATHSASQAAFSRITSASALDDPMLSYAFAPATQASKDQDVGQKIQLSQTLPWPGKLALREKNARFKAQASVNAVELVQLQLITTSAQVYADWFYIHAAIHINRASQNLWREFHAIAEIKYSAGRASKQDTLRAEVEQAMLEHQAIVLQRKRQNIQIQINTLVNRAPDKTVPSPALLNELTALPTVTQLSQLALKSHPQLKKLLALQQSSNTVVKLAERDYYPDFTINAGYNSLWNQENKRFSVGVGINIPFGSDKRDAVLSDKKALSLQLHWTIIDTRATITGAVHRAYNRIDESKHVVSLYQTRLLPLAEENLQTSKADYQAGKGDFLALVTAEKNLIQTQLNQVQARSDYQRHLALLAHRVGEPRLLDTNFNLTDSHSSVVNGGSK